MADSTNVPDDGKPGIVEIHPDAAGEWRFRIKGGNGEIVASGEGYTRKHDAVRGYETLVRIVTDPATQLKLTED